MMDSDSSHNLEASFSIIMYHCLLIKEVCPDSHLPSHLPEVFETTKALRDFDRFLLVKDTSELVTATRKVFNANPVLVSPLQTLRILLEQKSTSKVAISLL